MIFCLLCALEAVVEFTGNRRSYKAFNITENKTEKFGIEGLRIWKWVFDENLVKWEKSEWKERMREKKWDFAQIPSFLAILYRRKGLEITIQRSSTVQYIIGQKLCCNNCCQVAVLEELAWTANSVAVILKKSVWSDSECLGNSNSV